MKNICVVGLGHIGLPISGVLAEAGMNVHGVDIDENVIDNLQGGSILIEEPGLEDLIRGVVKSGRLTAGGKPEKADVFIVAVPTPVYDDESANITYVEQAVKSILPYLNKGNAVIVESTVPPRTIQDKVAPVLEEAGWDVAANEIYLAHCPERVIPGSVMKEIKENTLIIGGYTKEAAAEVAEVYKLFLEGEIIETTAITAEMSKLMENTYRDVNIALANELAKISAELDVNAHEVIRLANVHPRVELHEPGPGVGGHCIPVDSYFVIEKAKDVSPLMQTAREINNSMPEFVLSQIEKLTRNISNPKIAVFGLSYKGDVDDVRGSPAIDVVFKLVNNKKNYKVFCHDPYVREDQVPLRIHPLEESLEKADVALVLVDHSEYKKMDTSIFEDRMKTPVVLDMRNCLPEAKGDTRIYPIGDLSGLEVLGE
ncbi:UDP-N-acetyl-D-mannosamine dehydrogenase [Salimicrobium jeotgali]|uniref:Nucleotide sugar dehydrogenase n=1 Tax=Salimicrobium jeotgali TaxID=1230341 RepID=K2GA44_9BACI|nr:nucleotide sugar dehydrogenase [Salimicrobium jeotgali]AKG03669.1 UDP-N-acetyl-D-mannosamine dehydrogenase [Salimicrobium jeotgali]EKE31958.1 nucleotide sugar dehydrogenase [Salimicrobium jeotgali]MBM7696142.1 UDP-N-acetyl-D-mannosaminuronic acid dehydrogenase [Salimicrobium jeotgali]